MDPSEMNSEDISAVSGDLIWQRRVRLELKNERLAGSVSQVLPWLYLGSRFNAANEKKMTRLGFTHVLNTAKGCIHEHRVIIVLLFRCVRLSLLVQQ